jgi:nitrous oxidase accessory protein
VKRPGTRTLFLAAAALTAGSIALPLWGFRMSAPQYPDETLALDVTARAITGDVDEIARLQQYVGIRFPAEMPELRMLPRVLAGLAAALVVAGLARGRAARVLAPSVAALLVAFLIGSAALVQARLHTVGHERDRKAPLKGVKDFTPPLVGPAKVGNFTMWAFPHAGGLALGLAGALAVAAARRMRRVPVVLLALAAGLPAPADARTWQVGGPRADFPFVSPAVHAAADGDEIVVNPGVYREDIVLRRTLALRGTGRPVLIGTGVGSVVVVDAPDCVVSGFAIEGSGTGLTNRMDAGITVTSAGNRIEDNVLRRVYYGIVVAGASENTIVGNDVTGFTDLPFGQRGDGIHLFHAPDNLVQGNRVTGQRDAIYFQYAPRSRAVGNVVEDSRYGLHDMFSDDAVIEGNTFRGCSAGANVMNSRRVALRANRFERNRGIASAGLSLKDCDASTVEDNAFADNAHGMKIDGSTANRLAGNRFTGNDTAIVLFASAESNVFTGNAFVRNGSDVVVKGRGSRSRWSESGRGNRWDRYRGYDFDGDGVGESAHPVLGVFEKIEGANPATRLFLRSPAAAALELAARLSLPLRSDVVDPHPLVGARTW